MTQLLIQAFHQKLAHAGQDHILAQLREQFWKGCCAQGCTIMSDVQETEGS